MTRQAEFLAMAADHLYGDNLPGGGEVHIERLAALLARVRSETLEEAAALVEELRRTEGWGLDAAYFARRIRALAPKGDT
jgi:hypothetical protein